MYEYMYTQIIYDKTYKFIVVIQQNNISSLRYCLFRQI